MSDATQSYFSFEIGGARFAVPAQGIREVVPLPLLSCPPGIPSVVSGFFSLKGRATPVLNLKRLLGEDSPYGLYAHLLVLSGSPMALMVDRALGPIEVDSESISPVEAGCSLNACLEGTALVANETYAVLSLEKLLFEEERRRIEELRAREDSRLRELEATS